MVAPSVQEVKVLITNTHALGWNAITELTHGN